MTGAEPPPGERNRLILRRSLSAISHLWAAWSLALASMVLTLPPTGEGVLSSRLAGWFMLGHALVLALAGWTLWRPRRGAWLWVALAAAGSLLFVAIDAAGARWQSLPVDLMYALVAALIRLQTRA